MDGALHVADFEKRFSRVKFPLVTSIMRPVLYGRDLKGRYCLQQLLLVQASPEPGAPDKEAGTHVLRPHTEPHAISWDLSVRGITLGEG